MGVAERKIREKEKRVQSILQAAEKLIFEKGARKCTMDDIAQEAELSKGTLYLYFRNKEDLHYSLVMKALDLLSNIISKKTDPLKNGIENLKLAGQAYMEFYRNHHRHFKLMSAFDGQQISKVPQSKLSQLLNANSPLSMVRNIIEKGQQDMSIRKDIPPINLTLILWSQITGFLDFISIRQPLLDKFNINQDEIIQNQFEVLLNGIIT